MPRILLDLAAPMNGASLIAGLDGSFKFRTHPSCGGYSGYFPLRRETSESGGAEFDVDVDVHVGTIGIAAVDSEMAIICERLSSRGGGAQSLHLRVPDLAKITGLLLRNADDRGLPSQGILKNIVLRPCAAPPFALPKPTVEGILSLPLRRRLSPVGGTEGFPLRGRYQIDLEPVSISETVVVVIDPWAEHPCEGWARRAGANILGFLVPALTAFRSIRIPIIYAPHDRSIHPAIVPNTSELVMKSISDAKFIAQVLKDAQITRIIYMGYASNYCLMSRPIGVINMWREGFGIVVVRDASIAIETPETFGDQWSHQVMMDFVEGTLGATVTVNEIREACKACSLAPAS